MLYHRQTLSPDDVLETKIFQHIENVEKEKDDARMANTIYIPSPVNSIRSPSLHPSSTTSSHSFLQTPHLHL